MAWSIRNYNAFVKEAQRQHGVDRAGAQGMYQTMKERLGRPCLGVDIKNHPRIASRAAERQKTGQPKAARQARGGDYSVNDVVDRWEAFMSNWEDFEYDFDEYESSADYGEVPV